MSLGSGTLSLRRFRLLQKPRETSFEWLIKCLKKNAISPVMDEDEREAALGWCHPFNGEPKFRDAQDWIYDRQFVFAMRKDQKKIPATVLQLQWKAALSSLHDKINLDGEKKISKKVKDALRERIKSELLRRTLPQIRLTEVVWNLDSNEIWLTSGGQSVVNDFEMLFGASFELPLIALHPGTAVVPFERIQEGLSVNLQPIMDLVPLDFVQKASHSVTAQSTDTQANEFF